MLSRFSRGCLRRGTGARWLGPMLRCALNFPIETRGVDLAAEIVKVNPETPDMRMISYIADRFKAGQVVGMPTDTFYGLAADPLNLRAVDLIYEVKTRSRHKPLSLLIESVDQA